MGGRATRALLAAILIVVASGCWQGRRGLTPPDLAEQVAEVDGTISRLSRLVDTVDDELDRLRSQADTFFATPQATWRAPFPLDAFKHVAMSCLNAPYSDVPAEPEVERVARKIGTTCAVPAAVDLEGRLSPGTDERRDALAKLLEIDALRSARAQLQSRLRQLPGILRRARSYVEARRSEALALAKNVKTRRTEYARRDYAAALEIIEDYEKKLAELERQLERLESSSQSWNKELGVVVERIYKDLSRLGRT